MRNKILVRLPRLSQKLRVLKNLGLKSLVKIKHGYLSQKSWVIYFIKILLIRKQRKDFLSFSLPRLYPTQFMQGLRTSYSSRSIWRWHRVSNIPILIVRVGAQNSATIKNKNDSDAELILRATTIYISENQFPQLGSLITQNFPDHDVILIDETMPNVNVNNFVLLKHAAYKYPNSQRISVVTTGHQTETGECWATFASRETGKWVCQISNQVRDYGQFDVPRYVLGAEFHATYIKNDALRKFALETKSDNLNLVFNSWLKNMLSSGQRILEYSPAKVISKVARLENFVAPDWFFNRNIFRNSDTRLPIIFVLPATSMSGGIRAVLEKAEALIKLGEQVEVWSLQGTPTWTEISFEVHKFNTYSDITDALATRNALKVATWWETAEPVFLGSIELGIPIQYVQEFETWFYPGNDSAKAAVVSNYRPEFAYTTTASYQRDELAEVGINAPIIPPAFDSEVFFSDSNIPRQNNTLLALGRSFFQKNFQQTLQAWKKLGDERPWFKLFGFEPDLVRDVRASYEIKPSDEEIADLYRTSTAFIQTSLHEGFSLPIIEAMACGCPVITTDSHGNRDFCIDGVNCLIVEQGDIEGTSRAISTLLLDPELRSKLSQAGVETARRYSWNRVAQETAETYRKYALRGASL